MECSGFDMMELCKRAMLLLLSTGRLFGAKADGVLWTFTLNCFTLLSGSTAAAGIRQCQSILVFGLGALFLASAVAEQPLKLSSAMGGDGSILKRCFFSLGKY